jgi:anti-sigma-K factor RskA
LDIKEYIATGIVEGYVLGSLSDQERREVECMSAIYPELKAYVLENQQSFEEFALQSAKNPPLELKAKIMSAIAGEPQIQKETASVDSQAKVIRMTDRPEQFNWKMMVAATFVIALISSVMYFRTNSKNAVLTAELNEQVQQNTEGSQKMDAISEQLASLEAIETLMMAPKTTKVNLNGTDVSPDSRARIHYNEDMKMACLIADKLPMPEQDKQYQLWALIDGKPMDLGVFDVNENSTQSKMIQVKSKNIQGFAITKEKLGGSKVPTLEQMYVYGGVVASL